MLDHDYLSFMFVCVVFIATNQTFGFPECARGIGPFSGCVPYVEVVDRSIHFDVSRVSPCPGSSDGLRWVDFMEPVSMFHDVHACANVIVIEGLHLVKFEDQLMGVGGDIVGGVQ
jgi:hypothetical protein